MGVESRSGRRARLDEGQEGGIISHIDSSGTPSISEDQPSQLQAPLQSEGRLSAKAGPDEAPGVYRLNRVTVKTYGGREHPHERPSDPSFGEIYVSAVVIFL